MTRFADPARCPDCGATLTPGSYTCPSCRLDLSGDLGRRLFTLLTDADRLLVQMRARSAAPYAEQARAAQPPVPVGAASGPGQPPPAPTSSPLQGPPPPLAPPMPSMPSMSSMPPMAGGRPQPAPVRGSAVPRVLLGLGALTLLVAISLFFAVTWAALGPEGRAVLLVLLTAATGAVTVELARRDLPAATEALGLVTLGLVAADVWAARDAGWINPTTGAQMALVLGTVLVVAGTSSALALTRTRAGRFVSGEAVAAVGAAVLASGIAGSSWGSLAGRLVVAVPLLAVLTVLSRLLGQLLPEGPSEPELLPAADLPGAQAPAAARRFRPMQIGTAGIALVTVVTWAALAMAAFERVLDSLTIAGVWGGGGLPLLAAGAYAALPALLPGPRNVRATALAVAVLPLTVLVTAPAFDETETTQSLVMGVTTLLLALVLATGPLPWARAVGTGLLVTVPVLLAHTLTLLVAGLRAFADAAGQGWDGSPGGRLDPEVTGLAAPWVLPLGLMVLVVTGFAVRRAVTGTRPTTEQVRRTAETSLVVAAHGALLVLSTPVVVLLALMLLTALRVGLDGLRGHPRMTSEAAGWTVVGLGSLALLLSAYDESLTLLACLVLGGLAVAHHRRPGLTGWAGGLALGPLGAGAVWSAAALLDLEGEWSALVVLLALGAWIVLRGLADDAPGGSHPSGWDAPVVGAEAGTVLAAGVTAVLGAGVLAPVDQQSSWTAVYLTVLGVVSTVVSLTRPERRRVAGWTGGVLLAAASWVRLADIGVESPEPYTLPSAVALLVVGWFHLRRDPRAGTLRAWSSGLGLALVPTLLWVLADPVSVRAFVLGLACLGLVLLGTGQRWAAPFVWGSAVGTALVLRLVAPVALMVGPFLVFAIGGVLLLVIGATWEQRLKDAERLRDYVGGLR